MWTSFNCDSPLMSCSIQSPQHPVSVASSNPIKVTFRHIAFAHFTSPHCTGTWNNFNDVQQFRRTYANNKFQYFEQYTRELRVKYHEPKITTAFNNIKEKNETFPLDHYIIFQKTSCHFTNVLIFNRTINISIEFSNIISHIVQNKSSMIVAFEK